MDTEQQQVYNKIATHLVTQGVQANAGGAIGDSCLYRSPAGLKCAIGCLISDENYHPNMENRDVEAIAAWYPDAIPDVDIDFLNEMQSVHDSNCNWYYKGQMKLSLANVAGMYGLDASILETLDFSKIGI